VLSKTTTKKVGSKAKGRILLQPKNQKGGVEENGLTVPIPNQATEELGRVEAEPT